MKRYLRQAGRNLLRGFGGARSGQVAILFALASIPILFIIGASVDYGRRNVAKSQLDAALDGALLAVLAQKSNTISQTSVTNMETQFRAEAAKVPGVTVSTFTPNPPVNGISTLSLSASYTANVKTTMGAMMNVPSLKIGGTAESKRNIYQYINFYLLLDNSPSMGLAATDTDVANMQRVTGGCAFACHKHTYDSRGNITGDDANDNYHIAQRNNITLRIHMLRNAVSALVDQAVATMTLPQQFQMEMWTFNDTSTQTRLQAMTSTLSQIKSAAPNIDIAYAYQNETDNQTDFERAIAKMNTTIPASGTGITAASPIRFLFFVTDGVEDTGGSVTNQSAGFQVNGSRFVGPLNPATCNTLKNDKNVRIGVIYTQYLPIPSDWFYRDFVQPYENRIGPMLKACASEGLYFPVASGGDITAAMLKLFEASVASVRISN